MNLALEAFQVSCEGKLGCLHQKLLTVICWTISTYITIWIFLLLISCMKQGFAGLSSFLSICHIFACFQVHRVPKSSSTKNLNLYLSHTFDNILSTLHTIYLLADLIILLWWVHANANLIMTVHPGFVLHPYKIFLISLQSVGNSILFSWVSKYMHFLLTLRVQCRLTSNFNRGKFVTPKAQRKEQHK